VLQGDTDGIRARLADSHVRNDGNRPEAVSLTRQRARDGINDRRRLRLFVRHLGRDHLLRSRRVHDNGIRIELTPFIKALLCETKCRLQKSVKVSYGDSEVEVDYLCIAGGRAPDTEALGLSDAGVKTGDGDRIEIDEYQRTSNEKVYAIGDLVRGPALAHKAA